MLGQKSRSRLRFSLLVAAFALVPLVAAASGAAADCPRAGAGWAGRLRRSRVKPRCRAAPAFLTFFREEAPLFHSLQQAQVIGSGIFTVAAGLAAYLVKTRSRSDH